MATDYPALDAVIPIDPPGVHPADVDAIARSLAGFEGIDHDGWSSNSADAARLHSRAMARNLLSSRVVVTHSRYERELYETERARSLESMARLRADITVSALRRYRDQLDDDIPKLSEQPVKVIVGTIVNQLDRILDQGNSPPMARPEIVCLCGSTRFYDAFQEANYRLTMAGRIVLSVGFYPHAVDSAGHGEGVGHDSAEKAALDELHKRKIDLCDRVLVLDVGGYIGSSTRSEISHAEALGKVVEYLEPL